MREQRVEKVVAGLLDYPRKRLPEAVWKYDTGPLPKLRPDLRQTILTEARRRLSNFGAELIGANLYGGAATFQYNQGADIDVSLYVDWPNFKGNEALLQDAFKNVEIPWDTFRLHLFIKSKDQPEQVEVADAFYDVLRDKWKLPPLMLPRDFDPDVYFKPMIEMAEQDVRELDVQMGIVAREWAKLKKSIRARGEQPANPEMIDEKIEFQKKVLRDEIDKLGDQFREIHTARRKLHDELRKPFVQDADASRYLRYQYPEVAWKYLDQAGYAEFLKVLNKARELGVIDQLLSEI